MSSQIFIGFSGHYSFQIKRARWLEIITDLMCYGIANSGNSILHVLGTLYSRFRWHGRLSWLYYTHLYFPWMSKLSFLGRVTFEKIQLCVCLLHIWRFLSNFKNYVQICDLMFFIKPMYCFAQFQKLSRMRFIMSTKTETVLSYVKQKLKVCHRCVQICDRYVFFSKVTF